MRAVKLSMRIARILSDAPKMHAGWQRPAGVLGGGQQME
jgi:hypothetical protein